jgi:DNA-binding transcriptional regulator YhcF (GntR family)
VQHDLTIAVDLNASTPVYRQIVDALRHHLVEGRLRPGDLLPPVRQLAIDLGVHFNTVAQAYRLLAEEGWLDLRRRRGAMVLDRSHPAPPDRREQERSLHRLREVIAQLRAEGIPARSIAGRLRRLADGIEGHRA